MGICGVLKAIEGHDPTWGVLLDRGQMTHWVGTEDHTTEHKELAEA